MHDVAPVAGTVVDRRQGCGAPFVAHAAMGMATRGEETLGISGVEIHLLAMPATSALVAIVDLGSLEP